MQMNKGLFLDRDGTLIVNEDYLSDPNGVAILPGVKEGLQRALDLGYLIFLFTNQSGINRGYYTHREAVACNDRMIDLLGLGKDLFTEICIAPERPDEVPVYRKPSPKFILEMIEQHDLDPSQSWMAGDKWIDAQAGLNAKINGVWLTTLPEASEREEVMSGQVKVFPDFHTMSLQALS